MPAGEGAMAALLGMDRDEILGICREGSAGGGVVAAASYEAREFGVKVSTVCCGPVKTRIYGTPILGERVKDGTYYVPPRAISSEKAARIILKGVEKNKRLIIFPLIDRLSYMLYRIHPSLLNRPFRKKVLQLLALTEKKT